MLCSMRACSRNRAEKREQARGYTIQISDVLSALYVWRPLTMPAMTQPFASNSSRRADPRESNVKETVEQILIAFILAFIFRCFIVEAFVIPTGSMAPTLLGAHMDFRCPDCGWHWKVNYSGDSDGDDVRVPAQAEEVYTRSAAPTAATSCRACSKGDEANDAILPDRPIRRPYPRPEIHLSARRARTGGMSSFSKARTSARLGRYSGVEPYTQNYIKRLIGRPGETIMVLDGDIYVSEPRKKPTEQLN